MRPERTEDRRAATRAPRSVLHKELRIDARPSRHRHRGHLHSRRSSRTAYDPGPRSREGCHLRQADADFHGGRSKGPGGGTANGEETVCRPEYPLLRTLHPPAAIVRPGTHRGTGARRCTLHPSYGLVLREESLGGDGHGLDFPRHEPSGGFGPLVSRPDRRSARLRLHDEVGETVRSQRIRPVHGAPAHARRTSGPRPRPLRTERAAKRTELHRTDAVRNTQLESRPVP